MRRAMQGVEERWKLVESRNGLLVIATVAASRVDGGGKEIPSDSRHLHIYLSRRLNESPALFVVVIALQVAVKCCVASHHCWQ